MTIGWRHSAPDGDLRNPDWEYTLDGDYVPKGSTVNQDGDRVYRGKIIDADKIRREATSELLDEMPWM